MTESLDHLDIAIRVARKAGELARTRRLEGVSVAASKLTISDIVTHADREVEQLIRSLLAQERPEDGFCGEESGAATSASGLTWVVDPIDGTVNYFYGIPQYAVSIALVEGEPDPLTWKALAGVVFNPESGELFTATAGGGAQLNGRPIQVSRDVPPAQALIGTGFGYRPEARVGQAKMLQSLVGQVRDIRRFGAASLDLCAVACGRFDAYFERGLQPWDYAAAALIAAEAGATVTGWGVGAPTWDLALAGDAPLVEFLTGVLAETEEDWAV